jgi:hypothetical protein
MTAVLDDTKKIRSPCVSDKLTTLFAMEDRPYAQVSCNTSSVMSSTIYIDQPKCVSFLRARCTFRRLGTVPVLWSSVLQR